MQITDVRAHHLRIPCDPGIGRFPVGEGALPALDMVLVEVSTDAGLTGWGDAFAYGCARTTAQAVRDMVAPLARGLALPEAPEEIPALADRLQRALHLFGRYGVTLFALSGLDIALLDLAARARGVPLHRLFGPARRTRIPAYASLLKIGDPDQVARESEAAHRRGFPAIKLHETTVPAVTAARRAIGPGVPLMVDMNCPFDAEEAIAFAHACREADPLFLEEPVWPPEDGAALARVRQEGGVAVAAGENACTVHQFRALLDAGAVSHAQPSVTKVGGITEYRKIAALAGARGVRLAPHSPYFGPGLLATLQMLARTDDGSFVEWFHVRRREACLWHGAVDPDAGGMVTLPKGPGLGMEPDRVLLERYSVA
jgi:L-alanine-DL-glutamate epimerase-like enolase superfamily enzyme